MRWRSCSPLPGRTSGFTVPNIRLAIMRTVTLSGTSNSGTILSVGTPDSSTGRRSKSTTSTWNSRSQRELTVNQLSGKLGADHCDITAGRELQTTDDLLRPVDNPEIPQIARILPADTSYQIVRAAGMLSFDCTDMLAEVANATTRNTGSAGHQLCAPHNDHGRIPAAPQSSSARLASTCFPRPPLTPQASPGLPRRPAAPARRQRLDRLAR